MDTLVVQCMLEVKSGLRLNPFYLRLLRKPPFYGMGGNSRVSAPPTFACELFKFLRGIGRTERIWKNI